MSLNKILLGNGSVPKLACDFKSVSCDGAVECKSIAVAGDIVAETCVSTDVSQSQGDKIRFTATPNFAFGIQLPVNLLGGLNNCSLVYNESKYYDYDSGGYKYSLNMKGRFVATVGVPAAANEGRTTIIITDPNINARYTGGDVVYRRGGINGQVGQAPTSLFLLFVSTNVAGQLTIDFEGVSHADMTNGELAIGEFELQLLEA